MRAGAAIHAVDAVRQATLRQLVHRPRRALPPRVLALGLHEADPPAWRPLARGAGVDTAPQSGPAVGPEADATFRLVGSRRRFGGEDFWTDESDGLLFLFGLHGFGALAVYAAGEARAEADAFWTGVWRDWLSRCARPTAPGWHPYPLSHRVIAWSAALSRGGWPPDLERSVRRSLVLQVRYLRRSIEHDIGGNHVLLNAAALLIGGSCIGDASLGTRGRRLLERELAAQLLEDGGHCERSTSYHRHVTDLVVDAAAVTRRAGQPSPALDRAIARMEAWTAALTAPDGSLPLLNDAWAGPPLPVVGDAGVTHLAASGYVGLRADGDFAVLDVGALCPPHLPPHAHADALSFTLWADGKPVVADPGAYTYAGPERDAFRGTAAHSTITIDGADQCRFWGPFRATALPGVRVLRCEERDGVVIVEAEHDGYRRLADPVVHRRLFCWIPGDGLVIVDRLFADARHAVVAALPLAPGVDYVDGRAGPLRVTALGEGPEPTAETAAFAPYLGVTRPTVAVRRTWTPDPGASFGWALTRRAQADLRMGALRILRAGAPDVEVGLG
jgi:uncharacterized heparinase superfamily protein